VTLVRRSLDLPYQPEEVFALVSDVRRYPEFVKWLTALNVTREGLEPDGWRGEAEAAIGFKGLTERFVTAVVARAPAAGAVKPVWSVDADLVRGPFRKLRTAWRVTPVATGSRVEFLVEFEFRSVVLQALAAANLDQAIRRLMACFTEEAARRYAPIDERSGHSG
jgi:coenzyme Q-binding protein COQ10